MANFSLVSLNVRGLNNVSKRRAVFNWFENRKFDVVLLQETYTTIHSESLWNREWKGPIFYAHGSSNSRGCCILIRENLDFKVKSVLADKNGRYIILQCLVNEEAVTIINVYCPNSEVEQIKFYDTLCEAISSRSISVLDDLILAGDWNVVRDVSLDKSGGNYAIKAKSIAKLNDIISQYNLSDAWRIKNPNSQRFTWRQTKPLIQCRLDFILLSESLYDNIIEIDIVPSIRTDHSAVTIKLGNLPETKVGPSLWKFNASLLQDTDYTKNMKANLVEWSKVYNNMDSRVRWELIKYEIRKYTI